MTMAIKKYKTFLDSIEANIALTKLQANGIPCFLTNENINDLCWHMKIGLGGVQLMLDEVNFRKADELLRPDPILVEDDAITTIHCPKCNSTNVNYSSRSQPKFGWASLLRLLSMALFIFPAPVPDNCYHCFNCGHEFEEKEADKIRVGN